MPTEDELDERAVELIADVTGCDETRALAAWIALQPIVNGLTDEPSVWCAECRAHHPAPEYVFPSETPMPSAEKDVPCRLAESKVWHPAHNWNPMVADPEDPQVLHVFTSPEASLTCPGYRVIPPVEGRDG